MSETPASRNLRITITQQWPDERPGPKVDPVTIGEQVSGSQSRDEIVVVYDGDTAFMRLHIYYPQAEYHLKTLAIVWADRIIVGFAGRVVLVSIRDGTQNTISLSDKQPPDSWDYFCHILCDHDYLLVCSGQRVFRIGSDGRVLWKSTNVGLDGVIAHDVSTGVVHGSGEWDPPGGWRPFVLSLATGEAISA